MRKRIKKDQLKRVKEIGLLTYFQNYYPENLIKNGKTDYTTKTHSSLHMSNGMWFYWRTGVGGRSALDYLIKVEEYEFKDAVYHILDLLNSKDPVHIVQAKRTSVRFKLPKPNSDNKIIIDYLVNKRKIDLEIVNYFIQHCFIYESQNDHSVVFVGYDEFCTPKFATKRATDTNTKKDVFGSNKEYSFSISNQNSDTLHVFESAIDLLSFLTILKNNNEDYLNEHYLALGGVSGSSFPALSLYLKKHGQIKFIYLHLDNDKAGDLATTIIYDVLKTKYYVFDHRNYKFKDLNDFLKSNIIL